MIRTWVHNNILPQASILGIYKKARLVFTFHDISERHSAHFHPVYSTEPQVFIEQIKWIRSHFKILSLDALMSNHDDKHPSNVASIVFDDGFLSVYTSAFPFLKKEGIPFSIFVNKFAVQNNWLWSSNLLINLQAGNEVFLRSVYEKCFGDEKMEFEQFVKDPFGVLISQKKNIRTDWFEDENITKTPIYLSETQLIALNQNGVHIASHTVNHKILSSCSSQELESEIAENCAYLENLSGSKVDHLAIPFGFPGTYDQRALQTARKFHTYIYSTDRHLVTQGPLTPRLGIRNDSKKELVKHTNVAVLYRILKQLWS